MKQLKDKVSQLPEAATSWPRKRREEGRVIFYGRITLTAAEPLSGRFSRQQVMCRKEGVNPLH